MKLAYCEGQCAGDALLCVPHERIRDAIKGAVTELADAMRLCD